MTCPTCGGPMKVVYGPVDSGKARRRRYECANCPTRVSTEESIVAVDEEGKLPVGRPWHRAKPSQ